MDINYSLLIINYSLINASCVCRGGVGQLDIKAKRLLSMVSLAKKAGKLVTGEEGCQKAIQKGQVFLLLLATDASQNTKKKFTNKTTFYKVPMYSLFTKDEMGLAIGASNRATIGLVCENFSKKILEIIVSMEGHGG